MPGLFNPPIESIPEADPNVSPEEQRAYEEFIDNAFKLIYDDKAFPAVLRLLQRGYEEPSDALANATFVVLARLEDSAKDANHPISPEIMFHGGLEILEDLAGLSQKARIRTYDDVQLEAAIYKTLDLYRRYKANAGELDPAFFEREASALAQNEADGLLDHVNPGLKIRFGRWMRR